MIAPRAPALGDPDTATGGLAALRAGQPDAIALCYEAHASGLLALAYRLTGSRDDAEDIVHDVFVGLPQALRNYEERGQFGAWLKRITARTALMQQRRARNRRETPTDVNLIPSVGDADVDALKAHGFDDEAIWDIGAITAFFAMSNRLANLTSMRPNDEFYLMGRLPKT